MTQEYEDLMNDMKKENEHKAELKQLRHNYDCACNAYVAELLRMWELDAYYGYWVADEVGGVYAYGDSTFLNMEDLIYCVHHGVSHSAYLDWQDYCSQAAEFGLHTPNFQSWMKGCPRTSEEKFAEFRRLKTELEKAIDEEKQTANVYDEGTQTEPPAEHPGEVVITTAPPTFDNNPY